MKKNKKGFTLAELLIVVAIIAVLTAIAVPLFVTSLHKAEEATFNANKDTVRTAGIVAILNDKDDKLDITELAATDTFEITGTFKDDGTFDASKLAVRLVRSGATTELKPETDYKTWKSNKKEIIVHVKVEDVTNVSVTVDKGAD